MKTKKKITIAIFVLVSSLLIPFALSVKKIINQFESFSNIESYDTTYKLQSDTLKVFNIRTKTNDTIKLSGFKLINFWASWCKPCIEEQPSLEKIKKNGIDVIQLSFDTITLIQKVILKNNWSISSYHIKDTNIFKIPTILPKTYLLKGDTVLKIIYGAKNWQEGKYKNMIDSLSK